MARLGIALMISGALWALVGEANIVTALARHQPASLATVGLMVNEVLFVFPGLVVLGFGALLHFRRAGSSAPTALGFVACRTCRRMVAPDALTCPQCGAPEPSRGTRV